MGARQERFQKFLDENSETVDPFERIKEALTRSASEYDQIKDQLLKEYRVVTSSPVLTARDYRYECFFESQITRALMTFRKKTYLPRELARVAGAAIYGGARVIKDEWLQRECSYQLCDQVKFGNQIVDMLAQGFSSPEILRPKFSSLD